MPVVDQLVALLSYKVEGEADLKRFERQLDAIEKKARGFGKAVGIGIVSAVGAVATAMGLLANSVIQTNAEFETFEATLTTIEGSSAKAKQSMAWISEFARRTPYEVAGITAAFVKLKAYGIEPTDGTLKVLGDTASAMGKTLDQAVEAFADASTGQYERLREFGITTATKGDQVTLSWVKNGEKLSKTMKKTGTDVSNFLKELFGEKFGGAMEGRMNTWTGMMANLADAWTAFKRSIGDAGFFETMRKHLKSILDLIDRWDKDGTLEAIAKGFSYAFEIAADAVAYAFGRIARAVEWMVKNWARIGPIVKSSAIAFGILVAAMSPLTTIIGGVIAAMALLIEDFLTYQRGGESLIGEFFKIFPKFEQSLKDLFSGLGGTGIFGDPLRDIRYLVAEWEKFDKECRALWEWLKTAWAGNLPMQEAFTKFLAWLNGWVGDIKNEIVDFGTRLGEYILEGLKKVGDKITAFFVSVIPAKLREWLGLGGGGSIGGSTGGAAGAGGSGGDQLRGVAVRGARSTAAVGPGGPSGGGTKVARATMMAYAIDQLRKEGVPEANLELAAAHLVGQATMESGLNPQTVHDKGTGYGIYGARDPGGRVRQRRTEMYKWLAANNYARNSAEGQMRYMSHEAMRYYPVTAAILRNAREENIERDTNAITRNFEAPLRVNARSGAVRAAYASRRAAAAAPAASPEGALYKQFRGNYDKVSAGATINSGSRVANSSVNVTAPVSVHVANADHAPAATARAVGRAVDRGARTAAAPSRMQASPAA